MKPKHTPAPWIHDCSEIIDERGLRVCRFADYGAPSPEDMSVILAAPEMLRLLRVLVPMSKSGPRDREGWMVWDAALNEASELIARLDGDK